MWGRRRAPCGRRLGRREALLLLLPPCLPQGHLGPAEPLRCPERAGVWGGGVWLHLLRGPGAARAGLGAVACREVPVPIIWTGRLAPLPWRSAQLGRTVGTGWPPPLCPCPALLLVPDRVVWRPGCQAWGSHTLHSPISRPQSPHLCNGQVVLCFHQVPFPCLDNQARAQESFPLCSRGGLLSSNSQSLGDEKRARV
jgi:hypothetical protein